MIEKPRPTPEQVDLVIYHASCQDGFFAAWAAWKRLGDQAKYVHCQYNWSPPEVTGKHVAIVDFSFRGEVLEEVLQDVESLIILDHHKSTKEDLEGHPNAVFDLEKSGAVLSWEFFHPEEPPPLPILFAQDRDLWKWELPNSKAFSAGMKLVPFKFEALEEGFQDLLGLINKGVAILEYEQKVVEMKAKHGVLVSFQGHSCWMVNYSGPFLISELGNALCEKDEVGLALIWFYNASKRGIGCSLRSNGEIDVSALAKKLGGGGHPKAAGFFWPSTSIEGLFEFIGDEKRQVEREKQVEESDRQFVRSRLFLLAYLGLFFAIQLIILAFIW
jgi:hypothetical protein